MVGETRKATFIALIRKTEWSTVTRYRKSNSRFLILLVTESGLMYITTNEGAYEYNIGYKQLTKLPFYHPRKGQWNYIL